MARILVVEDNAGIAASLESNLALEGHIVELAGDGAAGLRAYRQSPPDLCVLDLMLPGMNGLDLLRAIREDGSQVPVLILSARSAEIEKVEGFRLGADDYVTKPFGLMELLARVDALLRRRARQTAPAGEPPLSVHTFGDVVVEIETQRVFRAGEPVVLRPKEFDLLAALLRHRGRVVSRKRLLREVWAYEPAVVSRTVDTHLFELRRKLEADPANPRHFHTLRGAGYRFDR